MVAVPALRERVIHIALSILNELELVIMSRSKFATDDIRAQGMFKTKNILKLKR